MEMNDYYASIAGSESIVHDADPSGELAIESLAALYDVASKGLGTLVFQTSIEGIEIIESSEALDPQEKKDLVEDGTYSPNMFWYRFSVRADLCAFDSRANLISETRVVQWLDTLNKLSERSAREVRRSLLQPEAGGQYPHTLIPYMDFMSQAEENEVCFGSVIATSAEQVVAWHRGLVCLAKKRLVMQTKQVGSTLFKRWAIEDRMAGMVSSTIH